MIRAVWDEGFRRSYRKRVKKEGGVEEKVLAKAGVILVKPFYAAIENTQAQRKTRWPLGLQC